MNEVVPEHLRGDVTLLPASLYLGCYKLTLILTGLVDIHAVFLILGYTVQGWVGRPRILCLETRWK